MAGSTLTFTLLARDQASPAFDHLGRSVDQTGRNVSTFSDRARTAARVGIGALAVGLGLLAKGSIDAARAAAADDAAAQKLANTARNAAGATDQQVASQERWISAQGRALGVADDELRPALGRLIATTHDVGDSQRLASLAMDVSAGSGKSLKTVTDALAKAQNGQMGGLSRLGVATTNVDGSTRSLNDVTAELAKTYQGAASTAANTAAGKFERVQIAIGETQEAIGARLLPVMGSLADVVLNNVLPRVDAFVAGMDDGTGAGGAFASAMTTTGHAIGGVVKIGETAAHLFGAIPEPLRNGAAQAGALALAIGLLAPRAQSAVAGLSALRGETSGLAAAQARLMAVSRGGAALLGGVALGFGSMAKEASGAQKAVGTLASVGGGALIGFAAGGPIGAAIGAGVSLLAQLGGGSQKASLNVNTLTDALDEQTGALTKNARAIVAQHLQQAGLLDDAQKLRLSLGDVTKAALGNEGAMSRLVDAEEAATRAASASSGATVYDIGKRQARAMAIMELIQALRGEAGEVGKAQAGVRQLAEASGKGADAATKHAGAVDRDGNALDKAARKAASFGHQLEVLNGFLDKRAAVRNYQGALDDFTKSVQENGRAFGNATAKGRANAGALDDVASAAAQVADGLHGVNRIRFMQQAADDIRERARDLGLPESATRAVIRQLDIVNHRRFAPQLTADLRARAREMGLPEAAAQRVIDRLQEVGRQHPNVKITADGSQANATLSQVETRLRDLNNRVARTYVITNYSSNGGHPDPTGDLPHRATGGPVVAGRAYRVGEQGEETFVPATSGRIIPHAQVARVSAFRNGDLSRAAAELVGRIVDGIRKGKVPLQKAIGELTGFMTAQGKKIEALKSSFAGSFSGFAPGPFGGSGTDQYGIPLSASALIRQQKTEAASAAQLRKNVHRLIGKGLSRSLIKQMTAAGDGGAQQIATLASASPEQIRQLNRLNKMTHRSVTSAERQAATAVHSDAIKRARMRQDVAEGIERAMERVLRAHRGEKVEVHVHLEGRELKYSLDKHEKRQGKGGPKRPHSRR